jgi:hypothetical protein
MGGLYAHNAAAIKIRDDSAQRARGRRTVRAWLAIAIRRDVVHRSFKVAGLVGTILALINYWDRFIPYSLDANAYTKIALTYCVPYCVSTYASVSATLARVKQ